MWSTRAKEDVELLELFEASGRNVQRASCLLRDLYAEYPERPELAGEVLACEHEGDRIAHEILSRLAERGTRSADLDAADVHALAGALDDIVDHAEEAADQLGLYGVEAPMVQAQQMSEVLACEHEGDRIAHEILSRLAERGAADLDAADVHALAGALDDIVDHAEEAADQLGLYGVEAPMEQAQQMAEILVGTADLVADSLRGLRDGEAVAQQLVEIHRRENEADRIVRAAVASLFATGIDPMTVIRWKDIYDTLESAVDACETVANVLEGITLKRAANGPH